MAKRTFELPGIQDLSKEQEVVRALPKDGQYLIVGGPGTGKTVMALIRARRHHRYKDDHVFLVYNHLLHLASEQLFGGGLSSATWQTWLPDQFREITGDALPKKAAELSGFRPIDWDAVADVTNTADRVPVSDAPFLVIDEGQDMPPEFYRSLLALGFERFFVAADQNQQIFDDNSSRKNIESELAIAPEAVIELKRNYRNSGPVARLARAFHTGDPASPPPELPPPGGDSALLCSYAPARFSSICERIVKIVDRDPRKLIGVIAPNNTVRKRYLEGLRAVDPGRLDSGFPDIETFHTGHRPNVRFDEGGILVINAQACKGLEFDIAVLADIDQHYFRPENPDPTRKQFYVMVARARERVIMLREQGTNIRIDKILPDDSDVLRRTDILERSRN